MQEITDDQRRTWILAALTAPAAHVASGLSWVSVAAVSLLAAGLRGILMGKGKSSWGKWIKRVLSVLAAGEALKWMHTCWPHQKDMQWVMGILLVLAALLAARGKKETVWASVILWWLTAFLLGSILLSAVPEITPGFLKPGFPEGEKLESLKLLLILLTPILVTEEKKQSLPLTLMPVLFSVCSQGVLSYAYVKQQSAPFYELSRKISLYGMMERMEGLAWLGMMLGTFLYLSFLLTGAVQSAEGKSRYRLLILAAAGAELVSLFTV